MRKKVVSPAHRRAAGLCSQRVACPQCQRRHRTRSAVVNVLHKVLFITLMLLLFLTVPLIVFLFVTTPPLEPTKRESSLGAKRMHEGKHTQLWPNPPAKPGKDRPTKKTECQPR